MILNDDYMDCLSREGYQNLKEIQEMLGIYDYANSHGSYGRCAEYEIKKIKEELLRRMSVPRVKK